LTRRKNRRIAHVDVIRAHLPGAADRLVARCARIRPKVAVAVGIALKVNRMDPWTPIQESTTKNYSALGDSDGLS
jgi:hypothetical protein